MTRVALAPCSPFTVTTGLMQQTAALAEELDVRLHTHLAENVEDDDFRWRLTGCAALSISSIAAGSAIEVGWLIAYGRIPTKSSSLEPPVLGLPTVPAPI